MFSPVTMLQRTLVYKTAPRLSRLLSSSRINRLSDSASVKNSDVDLSENTDESQNKSITNDVELPVGEENVTRLVKEAATYSDAKDTSWATTAYPAGAPTTGDEEKEIVRPKIDPHDTSVVLFPGQGTIKVGMVQQYMRFPQARELFEIANEILNYNLLKLCLRGPQKKLDQTLYNQPATVVASLAALEKLREERPTVFETCKTTAGYSIGELTSLIFSGAISFEDGIRLVSVRGASMQYASDAVPQGMLSVFCTSQAGLAEACKNAQNWALDNGVADPVCQTAIYLCTQTKIVAGNIKALEYIEKNAEKYQLRKLTRLPVSGAFHTKLMEPALKPFGKLLHTIQIHQPRCQVFSNYKGYPYGNQVLIKKYLPRQIVSPIKWEQSMQLIFNRSEGKHFPRTFDVGSGGRMKTILKLINLKASNNCTVY